MPHRTRIANRLFLVVVALNVVGIACFCLSTRARNPLAMQSLDYVADPSAVLESLGFTLMMPGIFFAAIAFLCARILMLSDIAAHLIWYVTGFAINVITAWKIGRAFQTPHDVRM